MIWSALFLTAFAQGLFLIPLLIYKGRRNVLATRLLITIVVLMMVTNFGYLVARTELANYIPQAFGISFGTIFLFGPLLYFYSRAVMDARFQWKKLYWLHLIPYVIQQVINLPLWLMPKKTWFLFIDFFLSGNLTVGDNEKIIFPVQLLHFSVYLFLTWRWLIVSKKMYGDTQYIIPVSSRIRWLTVFFYCFAFFAATVLLLYAIVLPAGKYNPVTNYIYTLITSVIIYFIAYKMVLNPDPISPGFKQKYTAYMQFAGEDGSRYLEKLNLLMNESKMFTNTGLTLSSIAEELALPSHQVSKLINEKLGKSFKDFVNEFRVQEFIRRINDTQYQSYTIYGIATDVGFSSKSSFNIAFKKITGKTPSEYKAAS